MSIERSTKPIAPSRLGEATRSLLDASTLCAIATVSRGDRAHINTAYFAWSPEFDIIWISEPHARHSQNLRADPSLAIAVFDSRQTWGTPDRGIQLFGLARELAGRRSEEAQRTYRDRFPRYEPAEVEAYRLYRFRPRRVKLFDERRFGSGAFVTATLRAGRLAWERTEVYRPGG